MILRGIITTILLVALTLVSFGHQTLSPQTEAQVDAYILAGGDWSDLCGEGEDPLAHASKCMACLIAQACALPAPAANATQLSASTPVRWTLAVETAVLAAPPSSHPARAPPFV
ncbi:hypothetical protein SLH49_12855 [Cognatiyoonia sp. IB215446]|uniref:hypothetical protein n=1 Tax=Cognatiyoonia sp. IB215446 TaxID=3097355 RepID=UPI002A11096A|nr:hypothetical protein [Cognatiyoonia sp. IB215446]MDX8348869.1 hypothetical protein [Cognatiyoonia sp. IB215446]